MEAWYRDRLKRKHERYRDYTPGVRERSGHGVCEEPKAGVSAVRDKRRGKGERVAGRAVEEGSDSHNVRRDLSRDGPRLVIVIASLLITVSHLGYSWGQTRQGASRNRINGLLESTVLRPACHVGLSPLGHFSSPSSSTSGK